jgi:DNA-binding transcriptional ArsR family regulator
VATNLKDSEAVLDALGDPTRRRVLAILRRGARSVGEIARRLPVSRPAVSQHLRVLKEAGLVRGRQEGARRLYRWTGGWRRCGPTGAVLGHGPGGFQGRRGKARRGAMSLKLEPIRRSIMVRCSVEQAFRVFTQGLSSWWPLDSHSRAVDEKLPGVTPVGVEMEPRVDGQVLEAPAASCCPGEGSWSGTRRPGW